MVLEPFGIRCSKWNEIATFYVARCVRKRDESARSLMNSVFSVRGGMDSGMFFASEFYSGVCPSDACITAKASLFLIPHCCRLYTMVVLNLKRSGTVVLLPADLATTQPQSKPQ